MRGSPARRDGNAFSHAVHARRGTAWPETTEGPTVQMTMRASGGRNPFMTEIAGSLGDRRRSFLLTSD